MTRATWWVPLAFLAACTTGGGSSKSGSTRSEAVATTHEALGSAGAPLVLGTLRGSGETHLLGQGLDTIITGFASGDRVAAGDINGDGLDEVIVGRAAGGSVIAFNQFARTFVEQGLSTLPFSAG